ncbi:MAG: RluA family pseudouridine synthase [Candidatus Binatia bacterium]
MVSEIVFPRGEEPKKLENFLKKRFPIGYVRRVFRKNGVRLNGKRAGPDQVIRSGDRVQLFIPFEKRPAPAEARPSHASDFTITYEDERIAVVNKPAGLAVQEGKNVSKNRSLLGLLQAKYRPEGIVPRLVHRLDLQTSGLLLIAKNETVAEELEQKFEDGEVDKQYLVLVVGQIRPREGRIDLPLPGREGKPVSALTIYKVEKEFPPAARSRASSFILPPSSFILHPSALSVSLVRATLKTGRMHQLRLHFAAIKHPVVMDEEHGDFSFNKNFRKAHGLKRQFLHASTLALEYGGRKHKWTAPLPDDLQRTLRSLEAR